VKRRHRDPRGSQSNQLFDAPIGAGTPRRFTIAHPHHQQVAHVLEYLRQLRALLRRRLVERGGLDGCAKRASMRIFILNVARQLLA
jgi:hypothetical protein